MSDTQPIQAPTNLPYGVRKELEDAQAAQPIAGNPIPSSSPGPSGGPVRSTGSEPGSVPSLEDPSAYPDEPLTAGLARGPGAGPESLLASPAGPQSLSLLRAIYSMFPDEDIRRLIERTELGL